VVLNVLAPYASYVPASELDDGSISDTGVHVKRKRVVGDEILILKLVHEVLVTLVGITWVGVDANEATSVGVLELKFSWSTCDGQNFWVESSFSVEVPKLHVDLGHGLVTKELNCIDNLLVGHNHHLSNVEVVLLENFDTWTLGG